ncbi:unnamed protein product [Periconia digitata]|uniref:Adenosine deaminase domain-containing protein n=1 Tax=Periconia digitata TaxID=1303443 RepID=A0A9W4URV3_9PLEO|nr:unnamed protein product [Periconia digitata]
MVRLFLPFAFPFFPFRPRLLRQVANLLGGSFFRPAVALGQIGLWLRPIGCSVIKLVHSADGSTCSAHPPIHDAPPFIRLPIHNFISSALLTLPAGTIAILCARSTMAHHPPPPVDPHYTRSLPKIELHAHLTGSITRQCLHQIWNTKKSRDPAYALLDPLVAMLPEYDINTFFPLFSTYTYKLCNDLYSIEYSTKAVLQDFQQDGVVYLELRTTPRAVPEAAITKSDYVKSILTILQNHNTSPENTMRAYLTLSVDRRNSPAEAEEVVDLALQFQSAGVVGLDLCGDCAKGDARTFSKAFARAKAAGLKVTLHFAEVEASATDLELETLLSFQPDRLGHVIQVKDIFKEQIEKNGIGIELCLSCNVQAKMIKGSYPDHHFGTWRHSSVPLALSTDDVGVFGSPLSQEYFLAATHFGLDRGQLKALAERPIPCIFGGEDEQARLRNLFSQFSHV